MMSKEIGWGTESKKKKQTEKREKKWNEMNWKESVSQIEFDSQTKFGKIGFFFLCIDIVDLCAAEMPTIEMLQ